MKQKEAVYQAVVNVCGEHDGAYSPTKEERATINQILFEGFRQGKIDLTKEFDDSELKTYCSGLTSNWLNKDTRLNGGTKYVAKNPGSRSGMKDPMVAALRAALAMTTSEEKRAEIQGRIDERLAEIKPTKTAVTLTAEQVELLKAAGLSDLVSE